MKTDQSMSWTYLFLGIAILFGAVLRLAPVLIADFPLNDGGMFFAMVKDLQASNYTLPAITTYNHLGIPFCYPSFPFLAAGILSDFFHVTLLDLFRFMPALITILTIPAYYLLVSRMTGDSATAAFAALAFSFFPRTYSWFIMGGGVSRAWYLLFYIFATLFTYQSFSQDRLRGTHACLAIVFNALVILSHPEAAVHAAVTGFLIWLSFGRSRLGLRTALTIGAGTLLVSSLWLLPVLIRHGSEPLLLAMQTGGHSFTSLLAVLVPAIGEEQHVPLFTVLGLIGLGLELFNRRYFVPLWFFLPFIAEPRSAPAISVLPLALAAGIALSTLTSRLFSPPGKPIAWPALIQQNRFVRAVLAYLVLLSLICAFSYDLKLASVRLSEPELEAMAWIADNTEEGETFVTLTGTTEPLSDPVTEWFPALTNRSCLNTVQGREWLLGKEFRAFLESSAALQACMNTGINCVAEWVGQYHETFDYLYFQKRQLNANRENPALIPLQLGDRADYLPLYENEAVLIYRRIARP